MGNTTVKQKPQVNQAELQEEESTIRAQKMEDSIQDSIPPEVIQEALQEPAVGGPVTSEDTELSTSEKEETSYEMADMASRLSSALEEKDDKLT